MMRGTVERREGVETLDSDIAVAVDVVRAALNRLSPRKRAAALAELSDVLQSPKAPHRGGEILNNVVELFQRDQKREWTAADVVATLADSGVTAESKPVYNALTYLKGTKVIRRIGYGRYQLANGTVVDGIP